MFSGCCVDSRLVRANDLATRYCIRSEGLNIKETEDKVPRTARCVESVCSKTRGVEWEIGKKESPILSCLCSSRSEPATTRCLLFSTHIFKREGHAKPSNQYATVPIGQCLATITTSHPCFGGKVKQMPYYLDRDLVDQPISDTPLPPTPHTETPIVRAPSPLTHLTRLHPPSAYSLPRVRTSPPTTTTTMPPESCSQIAAHLSPVHSHPRRASKTQEELATQPEGLREWMGHCTRLLSWTKIVRFSIM